MDWASNGSFFSQSLQVILWTNIYLKGAFYGTKTETKTRNSFKKFICDNINTIVVSSLTLAGGCAVGYAFGHTKGIRLGQGEILTKIVSKSCEDGLIMNNSKLGSYIFTAKKLNW